MKKYSENELSILLLAITIPVLIGTGGLIVFYMSNIFLICLMGIVTGSAYCRLIQKLISRCKTEGRIEFEKYYFKKKEYTI